MNAASLAEALAAFQAALPAISKDRTATVKSDKANYSYKYSDLADVTAAVLPKLAEQGLSWHCGPDIADSGQFVLRWRLLHVSGEQLTGAMPLPPNAAPQALGGVLTYYRRYLLTSVTGCVADEDDDGQRAQDGYREDPEAWASARPARQRQEETPEERLDRRKKRLFALYGEVGPKDRDERLADLSDIVGRTVGSSNDLAAEDVEKAITALERRKRERRNDA